MPKSQGVPLARWSRSELARHVARAPELPHVSASTIGRWLKAERIRPWRYQSWQHMQEAAECLERARPVLRLYELARVLLRQGSWLDRSDQKTTLHQRQPQQAPSH